MDKKKKTLSISDSINRPLALTKAVGGKPSENLDKVKSLAKNGTPLQKKQASYYWNVLRKAPGGKSKGKPSLLK